jgi:hypothetical protein
MLLGIELNYDISASHVFETDSHKGKCRLHSAVVERLLVTAHIARSKHIAVPDYKNGRGIVIHKYIVIMNSSNTRKCF